MSFPEKGVCRGLHNCEWAESERVLPFLVCTLGELRFELLRQLHFELLRQKSKLHLCLLRQKQKLIWAHMALERRVLGKDRSGKTHHDSPASTKTGRAFSRCCECCSGREQNGEGGGLHSPKWMLLSRLWGRRKDRQKGRKECVYDFYFAKTRALCHTVPAVRDQVRRSSRQTEFTHSVFFPQDLSGIPHLQYTRCKCSCRKLAFQLE